MPGSGKDDHGIELHALEREDSASSLEEKGPSDGGHGLYTIHTSASIADSRISLIDGSDWRDRAGNDPPGLKLNGASLARRVSRVVGRASSRVVRVSHDHTPRPAPFVPASQHVAPSASAAPTRTQSRWSAVAESVLAHRFTAQVVLVLIALHALILTIDASRSVYAFQNPNGTRQSWTDWALLGIFSCYTIEMLLKISVAGMIGSAATLKRDYHFDSYRFGREDDNSEVSRLPYLRRSWQRLDFICIVSYWLHVGLDLSGLEERYHIYIFRALSTLRIIRLLNITRGMSTILQTIKLAAPLLANVGFFVGFFSVFAAIIATQSFKSSLRRQCIWYNPDNPMDTYEQTLQFCGGHWLNGSKHGYLLSDGTPSLLPPKGYICPEQSLCVQGTNPFGGSISFDNLFQSMELVFVIISANTFTNQMYWTMDSDHFVASLFYIVATVILTWWLASLVIAVVTNSLQVVREEWAKVRSKNKRTCRITQAVGESEPTLQPSYLGWWSRTSWFWLCVVTADLLVQALKRADMSRRTWQRFIDIEAIFTAALAVEIVCRFIAYWPIPRLFVKSKSNCFDLFLALITGLIQLPQIRQREEVYRWLTVFQILRSHRIIQGLPFTRTLIRRVFRETVDIGNLLSFVLATTWIATLFAGQLIRGDAPTEVNGNAMTITFSSWINSYLGMYQILSRENWTDILFGLTSVGRPWQRWAVATLMAVWLTFSSLIVMSMFIAVLSETFEISESARRKEQARAYLTDDQAPAMTYTRSETFLGLVLGTRINHNPTPISYPRRQLHHEHIQRFLQNNIDDMKESSSFQPEFRKSFIDAGQAIAQLFRLRRFSEWLGRLGTTPPLDLFRTSTSTTVQKATKVDAVCDRSLGVFAPDNGMRRICQSIVPPSDAHCTPRQVLPDRRWLWIYLTVMHMATIMVVITTCIVTPIYQRQYLDRPGLPWYFYCDLGFTVLFSIEFVLKVVADGFLTSPGAYIKNVWNRFDLVVLASFWLTLIADLLNKSTVSRIFRAMKALRALRLVNLTDATKDAFHNIFVLGFWNIIAAATVALLLILPYALWGLNLFAGMLGSCNDGSVAGKTACLYEYAANPAGWDVWLPRAWENPLGWDFDTFGSALLILFEIVSQEGWTGCLFRTMSITNFDQQPQLNKRPEYALYFLAFNILGAVFVLTLFIACVIQSYAERSGVAYLTVEQRSWYVMRQLLKQIKPSKRSVDAPRTSIRRWAFFAVEKHSSWNRTVNICYVAFLIILATEHHPSTWLYETIRLGLSLALILVFVTNQAVRFLGFGPRTYLHSKWNLYNLVVNMLALVATLVVLFFADYGTPLTIQKTLAVLVCMNMLTIFDSLDTLFKTAIGCLPDLASIFATWLVLFLVFAIALNQIFGLTKFGSLGSANLNFRSIPKALVLLFRMSVGGEWNQLMHNFTISPPYCTQTRDFFMSDCGSRPWAYALFVLWNVLSMYIMGNVVLTVVLHQFSFVYQRAGEMSNLSRDQIRGFKHCWARFDDGTGRLARDNLARFLHSLQGSFEVKIYPDAASVPALLEDCCHDKHLWTGSADQIRHLNRALARRLDVTEIRRRRRIYNDIYYELHRPGETISFTTALLVVARSKHVDPERGFALEEYIDHRIIHAEIHRERAAMAITSWTKMALERRYQRQAARARAGFLAVSTHLSVPPVQRASSTSPRPNSPFSFTSDTSREIRRSELQFEASAAARPAETSS